MKSHLIALAVAGTLGLAAFAPAFAQSATDGTVTVINTISVPKEHQKAVAGVQLEQVEKLKRTWPGFISQRTLLSEDGTKVTTVEIWENMDTLKAIAEDKRLLDYRAKIQELGGALSPVLYSTAGYAEAAR